MDTHDRDHYLAEIRQRMEDARASITDHRSDLTTITITYEQDVLNGLAPYYLTYLLEEVERLDGELDEIRQDLRDTTDYEYR